MPVRHTRLRCASRHTDGAARSGVTFLGVALAGVLAAAPAATPQTVADDPAASAGTTAGIPAPASVTAPGVPIDDPPPPVPPAVVTRDGGRATVRAIRLTTGLRVDGRLDEPVYREVAPVSEFLQQLPDEGAPATERTDAWVMFDDENFYVSGRCWDSAPPSEWAATDMQRDSRNMLNNDLFGFLIDTFYDRRNALLFYANPLGGFVDQQITNEGNPNRDWNPVWDVRTDRFDGGWTIEMVVPFKSLRYRPTRDQVWGIQLRRTVIRKNEWAYLTLIPISAAGFGGRGGVFRVSAAGTLVGLEAPPAGRPLEVKPYAIGGVATDLTARPPERRDGDGAFGVDLKYGITENLTADFTYNTDFAQVEVDEQQVNLTRFNLFFPEKREFFLEGRGIFSFARGSFRTARSLRQESVLGGGDAPTLFYSRRIGLRGSQVVPILGGGRVTGKIGPFDVGALAIRTDDQTATTADDTAFTVLRVKRDLLRRSSIGALVTHRTRSLDGAGTNAAFGADASFSFFDDLNLLGYYARTRTTGRRDRDASYQARLDYGGDRYGLELDHLLVERNFRPEVGFLRRDNFRRTSVSGRFSPRPESIESVRQFVLEASLDYFLTADTRRLETRQTQIAFQTELENSDQFGVRLSDSYELLLEPFSPSGGATAVPVGGYDFRDVRLTYRLGPGRPLIGSVEVASGGYFGGRLTSVDLGRGRVDLSARVSVEPSLSLNWIDLPAGSFRTDLLRGRVTYTFTPRTFASGLFQYNSTTRTLGANLRLRWEYSPGSELFVVYTEEQELDPLRPNRSLALRNRAFVVKINRLFRF
ncbi:MAG: carbohydrate binding family 9 domain-containing protein [Acidobacteria bacterium]|nr:carbohydrate binding family 9 domain-containing protein [Acidobacteriota bacterium]